jgi:hypothetical protein
MLNLLEQKTYKTLERISNLQYLAVEGEQDHLITDEPYQESNPKFQHQAKMSTQLRWSSTSRTGTARYSQSSPTTSEAGIQGQFVI